MKAYKTIDKRFGDPVILYGDSPESIAKEFDELFTEWAEERLEDIKTPARDLNQIKSEIRAEFLESLIELEKKV